MLQISEYFCPNEECKQYGLRGQGVKRASGRKNVIEMTFSKPTELNHTILQEDLSKGQRVTEYVTEYSTDGKTWRVQAQKIRVAIFEADVNASPSLNLPLK